LSIGRLSIVKAPVDFKLLMTSTLERHQKAAAEKGLRLDLEALTELPEELVIDGARVAQCLDHMISNALKFTDEGYVRVSCAYAASPGPPRLSVKVKDTGIGMSEEAQARIFQRFSQGDMSETRSYSGMGLGLWISKILAQLMDGGLTVHSRLGAGSTFTLTLTAYVAGEEGEAEEASPDGTGEAIDLAS